MSNECIEVILIVTAGQVFTNIQLYTQALLTADVILHSRNLGVGQIRKAVGFPASSAEIKHFCQSVLL